VVILAEDFASKVDSVVMYALLAFSRDVPNIRFISLFGRIATIQIFIFV